MDTTAAGLERWNRAISGPTITDESLAEMRARPHFHAAARQSFATSLSHFDADPTLAQTLSDTGRYLMGVLALYLDATGGLTLARIQALVEQLSGLSSRGRAAALLIRLRMIGYVVPAPPQPDKRTRMYVPTDQMRTNIVALLRKDLTALALIEPEAAAILPRLEEPEVFRRYVTTLGEGVRASARAGVPRPAFFPAFADRTGGMLILGELFLESGVWEAGMRSKPVPVSVSSMARRFNISRSHVLRTLRAGEEAKLVARDAESGAITVLPLLRDEVERYQAIVFIGVAGCAYRALNGID